ncbi:MAG: ABC transporter ATP-binding protein [Christensenellales bacterium]
MRTLYKYVKPYVGVIGWTMFVKFFSAMMDLLIPSILARIIDEIVPLQNPSLIYLWGGIMIGCAMIALGSNIYANRMASLTAGKVTRTLRHDLFSKISSLSMTQLDTLTLSSAISRLTSDTYNINQFLGNTQRMGVRAPILLLGGIIMTLMMDLRLTLVLLLTLPFIALIIYVVTRKSVPVYTRQQTVLDRITRVMQENITGIRIIKALSKSEHEKLRFDGVNAELADVSQKAGRIVAASNPLTSLTLNLGLTLVVLAGAYLVNRGQSRPGTIIAFLNYFAIISQAMMGITRIFIMTSKGAASAKRVEEVLLLPEDLVPLPAQGQPLPSHILFDHVSFSYNKVEDNLSDISFELSAGDTLGIIGATGSGKTTLINLLLRFYDADKGRILIRGQDIRSLMPDQLRDRVGIAFQNDFIMAGSVRDNVRYYRDLGDEALWAALDAAQAADFVRKHPEGLDFQVAAKGNDLSGGQKQRLLIARALAGKPELLILDDSSSALDYRTDASLRRALSEQHSDTTCIIIAQRISSIRGADHILVLDDGRSIGYGTHEELMLTCPGYRDIALVQMGAEGGLQHV